MSQDKRGPGKGVGVAAAAVIALAALLAQPWEGRRNTPYKDIVQVWTVCDGHTGDVEQRRYSNAECDQLLRRDLQEANDHVRRCIRVPMPVYTEAAFTTAVFNAGPKLVCGSTLQRKANAGDLDGACAELSRWDYAGGRKVRGLTRRRVAERALCEGRGVVLP